MSTVAKIAALLTMAERSKNEHEADAFLRKAQQLATNASVDLALARAATSRKEAREQPISRTISIGELRKRANKHLISLFVAIAHANDVKVDIAHNSTYVIAYGMPSDIDVVEAMHNSLATQMVAFANEWLRTDEWKQTTYFRREWRAGYLVPVKVAHTKQSARGAFCAGFSERVAQRLSTVREAAVASYDRQVRDEQGALLSTAVVLREKAEEVQDFYRKASSARGAWRGYSGASGGGANAAGRAAAERANIGSKSGLGRTAELES